MFAVLCKKKLFFIFEKREFIKMLPVSVVNNILQSLATNSRSIGRPQVDASPSALVKWSSYGGV
jgi:hypothetical protein